MEPTHEELKRLRTTAISGWEAYKCCVLARNQCSRLANDLGNRLLSIASEIGKPLQAGPQQAVPWGLIMSIVRRVQGAPAPPQAVVTLPISDNPVSPPYSLALVDEDTGLILGWVDLLEWQPGAMAAQAPLALADAMRKKATEVCYECIAGHSFGQSKGRQRITLVNPTEGGDDKMRVRVPHQ